MLHISVDNATGQCVIKTKNQLWHKDLSISNHDTYGLAQILQWLKRFKVRSRCNSRLFSPSWLVNQLGFYRLIASWLLFKLPKCTTECIKLHVRMQKCSGIIKPAIWH